MNDIELGMLHATEYLVEQAGFIISKNKDFTELRQHAVKTVDHFCSILGAANKTTVYLHSIQYNHGDDKFHVTYWAD
ncbi:hypothetical protein MYO4S_00247 [Serratia phage 4S]|nr:hypothetical protein MYO4S_00247 [Serratia phage 4S]